MSVPADPGRLLAGAGGMRGRIPAQSQLRDSGRSWPPAAAAMGSTMVIRRQRLTVAGSTVIRVTLAAFLLAMVTMVGAATPVSVACVRCNSGSDYCPVRGEMVDRRVPALGLDHRSPHGAALPISSADPIGGRAGCDRRTVSCRMVTALRDVGGPATGWATASPGLDGGSSELSGHLLRLGLDRSNSSDGRRGL